MTWIQDFFLRLSGTDGSVLKRVSDSSRKTQTALGMLVFATATLAAFSGGYAVYTTFRHWLPAVLLGGIYGLLIMTIDYMIVSSTNRWVALARVPLAAVIGLVIAVPLEMKLFEDRIEAKLTRDNQQQNDRILRQLKSEHGLPRLKRQIDSLGALRQQTLREASHARKVQQEEIVGAPGANRTGKAGKGPAYRNAVQREKEAEARARRLSDRLSRLRERRQRLQSEVRETYEVEATQAADGLLARYEALGQLGSQSAAMAHMSWGVRLFLILLELSPALLKLLRPKSDYEQALKARRKINQTRINSFANKRAEKIKNNPENPPTPPFMRWFDTHPLST